MGYLDSDSITVDAILTKVGRKLLAQGAPLNPTQFALSDDGIDYNLFNVDHPSGSAQYGEAITELPQIEAVPDGTAMMRFKLLTLDPNTEFFPSIVPGGDFTNSVVKIPGLDNGDERTLLCKTQNYGEEQYLAHISDTTFLEIVGGTSYSPKWYTTHPGAAPQQEIAEPMTISFNGGSGLKFYAKSTGIEKNAHIQIEGMSTGQVADRVIKVAANR